MVAGGFAKKKLFFASLCVSLSIYCNVLYNEKAVTWLTSAI